MEFPDNESTRHRFQKMRSSNSKLASHEIHEGADCPWLNAATMYEHEVSCCNMPT